MKRACLYQNKMLRNDFLCKLHALNSLIEKLTLIRKLQKLN